VTLDAYLDKNSIADIAFLKVDVEGFEATVFEGARRLLSEHRAAVVYYEVCPGNAKNSGIEPERATRILLEHGYGTYKIDDIGRLQPVDLSEVERAVLENWVAVRP
jgi:hypothetical protein